MTGWGPKAHIETGGAAAPVSHRQADGRRVVSAGASTPLDDTRSHPETTFGLYAPWLDRDDYRQEAAIARLRGRSVRHHLIDVTRNATRGKHRLVSFAAALDEHTGPDTTLATVLEREHAHETLTAVAGLSARQGRCLTLAAVGYSVSEIATAERLTYKQAENALTWARRTLRERTAA